MVAANGAVRHGVRGKANCQTVVARLSQVAVSLPMLLAKVGRRLLCSKMPPELVILIRVLEAQVRQCKEHPST